MNISYQFSSHGFEILPHACPRDLLQALQNEFPVGTKTELDLIETSATIRQHAESGVFRQLASTILGPEIHPTYAILDTSTAEQWHQDTMEAESDDTFSHLLALRLSLDDATFMDGALKLCPSSHKHGRLRPDQIKSHAARPFSSPDMKAGDILLLHPLTIHASAASSTGKPNRVIHIVYSKP